jgi:octopine/nopaline transport system substrate-binding protein
MKILRFLGAAALSIFATIVAASAQEKSVTIATEGAYAPWNFTAAGGKLDGFEIDLANDLCARMKVKCEIVAQDWDGIIPALQAKKYDAIMAGMTITPKRQEVISFSIPYADTPSTFLAAKNSALAKMPGTGQTYNLGTQQAEAEKVINDLKAVLKSKSIGVQTSTIQAGFADKYLKDVADIREYKTTEAHDLDLAAGRIDAVFAGAAQIIGTLEKPEFKDYATVGPRLTGGVLGAGIAIGLRKDEAELKKSFDGAIQAAIQDGAVKKLSEKWFKTDITPQS